jgi:hypothetical protein
MSQARALRRLVYVEWANFGTSEREKRKKLYLAGKAFKPSPTQRMTQRTTFAGRLHANASGKKSAQLQIVEAPSCAKLSTYQFIRRFGRLP